MTATLISHSLPQGNQPCVHVIHENAEWLEPLQRALDARATPWQNWFIHHGYFDLQARPPEGVFYNRMSASSHTRDHRFSVELCESLLAWLTAHGRVVINGPRALHLEVRKAEQALVLANHGIRTPETLVAAGVDAMVSAARALAAERFIVKPNRGGKGLGVQLFDSVASLERWLETAPPEALSPDGISLIQRYIPPASGHITRLEFIGGEFFYAVQVDASAGFELCPADGCAVSESAFCPTGPAADHAPARFRIDHDFRDAALIDRLTDCFQANDIRVGAAEFVEDHQGNRYVYDINTNTNYNQQAELEAGGSQRAYDRLAGFLADQLAR
ncbi:MAG: ATP-grasp domain-containing protein [Wenzhouxiangella sp.]